MIRTYQSHSRWIQWSEFLGARLPLVPSFSSWQVQCLYSHIRPSWLHYLKLLLFKYQLNICLEPPLSIKYQLKDLSFSPKKKKKVSTQRFYYLTFSVWWSWCCGCSKNFNFHSKSGIFYFIFSIILEDD